MFQTCDSIYRLNESAPAAALGGQHLLSRGRQPVVAAPALAGLLDPAPLYPAAFFKPVQQRIQRGNVEPHHPARPDLDQLADLVAVPRAILDKRKNQQFGAALLKLPIQDLRFDISHSNTLYRHICLCQQTCPETETKRRAKVEARLISWPGEVWAGALLAAWGRSVRIWEGPVPQANTQAAIAHR